MFLKLNFLYLKKYLREKDKILENIEKQIKKLEQRVLYIGNLDPKNLDVSDLELMIGDIYCGEIFIDFEEEDCVVVNKKLIEKMCELKDAQSELYKCKEIVFLLFILYPLVIKDVRTKTSPYSRRC